MLIRLLFNNVLSFRDGTEFNLLPNPRKKRLGHHVYSDLDIPVVKATAIYGANGAGKSNILKGMEILRNLVLDKEYIMNNNPYDKSRYLLQEDKGIPMSFAVEFSWQEHAFLYHIDVVRDKITKEELFHLQKDGEDKPIFIAQLEEDGTRSLRVFEDDGEEHAEYVDEKTITFLKQNPSSTVMSLHTGYPILRGELVGKAHDWFVGGLSLKFMGTAYRNLVEIMEKHSLLLKFSNMVIPILLPEIKSMEVRSRKFDELTEHEKKIIVANGQNDKNSVSFLNRKPGGAPELLISEQDGELIAKDLIFSHIGPDNHISNLTLENQSEGVKQLINKMPILMQAFLTEATVFIDEIENGSHPLLIQELLQIFLRFKKTRGQLIFTTHEVLLLDQKHIRADEVWFAEKEEGCSKLYSLNDFKEHQTIDIAKGYLNGRYGAIPFYSDETVLNTPEPEQDEE